MANRPPMYVFALALVAAGPLAWQLERSKPDLIDRIGGTIGAIGAASSLIVKIEKDVFEGGQTPSSPPTPLSPHAEVQTIAPVRRRSSNSQKWSLPLNAAVPA